MTQVKDKKKEESVVFSTKVVEEILHKENMGLKLKNSEKLWLNNMKGVRRPNVPFAMTNDEIGEYLKCKMSIKYFIENYVNIKREDGSIGKISLRDYQNEMIDIMDQNRFSIFMFSRQSGKTIGTSIMILHKVLFSNDKNVLIVGNNGNTVSENIKKIKDIYLLLPYFLKKGVFNWAEKTISLDNGCRIKTANCTATAGIGNAVDFLYLDEFAKIPSNISEAYYGAVVPTVSSINNSKIVITSTPDGFNLFHKLLTDAERDEEDPQKNMYKSLRVYWHQVKGRMDVKILPLAYKLKTYKLTIDDIIGELKNMGYDTYDKNIDNKTYYFIRYDMDDEKTSIANVRNLRINNIPLQELCIITNWKEDETKLIGGENMFNQEYDLQFVTGDKLLFDSEQMNRFKSDSINFKYIQFPKLDNKLTLPYSQMKWIQGRPDIFDINKMKEYHICASVDLSEGLGQDYSVLNIFRIMPKSKELIEKTHQNLSTIYEYFYLEQIGVCRVNNWNMNEFAELFYMVMFELFDSEKVKVALEYNTYGSTFLLELTKIFDGEHNYSNGIFLRYKHRKDDVQAKIGLKITGGENEASKKLLIKSLQSAVKKQLIKIHNDMNINEISVFTKKITASGNFTYQCESGHDDLTMTLLSLSSVFNHVQYKNLIDDIFDKYLTPAEKSIIEKYVYNKNSDEKVNYESTKNSYKKIYKGNGFSKPQGFTPWKSSPWN